MPEEINAFAWGAIFGAVMISFMWVTSIDADRVERTEKAITCMETPELGDVCRRLLLPTENK